MLTKEQNDTLTHIGVGTPMGEMMRRYWIPALLDSELPEPDGEPRTIFLLGEELVAFRQTDGQIGVVGARCAHRRAHLFFGRNEDCGLRCVYHGWKYDLNGQCIDMPNEPAESNFKDRVRIPAYPTYETGGVIWVYMGPPAKQPAPPHFEWTQVEEPFRSVTKVHQECNWLQGLEGGIDSSHTNFLHGIPPHKRWSAEDSNPMARARSYSLAPKIEVVPTEYGYTYAGIRPMGEEGNFVRAYHWIAPWTQLRPGASDGEPLVHGHFWVPMDDHNTMVWNFTYTFGQHPLNDDEKKQAGLGNVLGEDVDATTFRSYANASNNYLIDRQVQKNDTYTGIPGTNTQDRAIQETMGPIADRTLERLGTADRAIITARRQLLAAVAAMQAEGADPPGADDSYYKLRSVQSVLPKDAHWLEQLKPRLFQLEEQPLGSTP
jgi:phenylpropionate dioxygenase-like ring-hydroxylating dioxygenase large terminal subunit